MNLVALTHVDKTKVWINPNQVIAVRAPMKGEYTESGHIQAVIVSENGSFGVCETVEQVRKSLSS